VGTVVRHYSDKGFPVESRYLDGLVGPLPEANEIYEERSPANHAGEMTAPLLVLQGGEDRVVPREQADW
jgi:dipeptidyl aminopeptidase/acylaminoacyl peptidase